MKNSTVHWPAQSPPCSTQAARPNWRHKHALAACVNDGGPRSSATSPILNACNTFSSIANEEPANRILLRWSRRGSRPGPYPFSTGSTKLAPGYKLKASPPFCSRGCDGSPHRADHHRPSLLGRTPAAMVVPRLHGDLRVEVNLWCSSGVWKGAQVIQGAQETTLCSRLLAWVIAPPRCRADRVQHCGHPNLRYGPSQVRACPLSLLRQSTVGRCVFDAGRVLRQWRTPLRPLSPSCWMVRGGRWPGNRSSVNERLELVGAYLFDALNPWRQPAIGRFWGHVMLRPWILDPRAHSAYRLNECSI
jgi:hypothetical protein